MPSVLISDFRLPSSSRKRKDCGQELCHSFVQHDFLGEDTPVHLRLLLQPCHSGISNGVVVCLAIYLFRETTSSKFLLSMSVTIAAKTMTFRSAVNEVSCDHNKRNDSWSLASFSVTYSLDHNFIIWHMPGRVHEETIWNWANATSPQVSTQCCGLPRVQMKRTYH